MSQLGLLFSPGEPCFFLFSQFHDVLLREFMRFTQSLTSMDLCRAGPFTPPLVCVIWSEVSFFHSRDGELGTFLPLVCLFSGHLGDQPLLDLGAPVLPGKGTGAPGGRRRGGSEQSWG